MSKKHPTEHVSDHVLDKPVTHETALKLCLHLGLTEGEAQALISAPIVSIEELHEVQHVDLHALAHAYTPAAVEALTTDPKMELPARASDLTERASRVRVISSACDKLSSAHDAAEMAARVDAGVLQEVTNAIVPQLRTRARVNDAVRTTYSPILAYQHARFPGRGHRSAAAHPPATTPGAGSK